MADTTSIHYIYPPGWQGQLPDTGGYRRIRVHLTGTSDGTGETDAIKINRSEWRNTKGQVPDRLVVEEIIYNVKGMNVVLEWDRTPDQVIAYLNGQGEYNFHPISGYRDDADITDGTGDITLTSENIDASDNFYDITLAVRLP